MDQLNAVDDGVKTQISNFHSYKESRNNLVKYSFLNNCRERSNSKFWGKNRQQVHLIIIRE